MLAVLLCAIPLSALAHDWEKAYDGKDMTFYIDTKSIKREGKLVSALELMDYKKSQTAAGKKYRSLVQLVYYDCSRKRRGIRHTTVYPRGMGKGKVLDSAYVEPDLQRVDRKSVGRAILDFVCDRR